MTISQHNKEGRENDRNVMSIRIKTVIIFLAATMIITIPFYFIAREIFLHDFLNQERDSLYQDTNRAMKLMNTLTGSLDTVAERWAANDETYQYMLDKNADYFEDDLNSGGFIDDQISYLIFLDTSKEIVYSKKFNQLSREATEMNQVEIDSFLSVDFELPDELETTTDISQFTVKGSLVVDSIPVVASYQPIVTSNMEGPVRGVVIAAAHLTSTLVVQVNYIAEADFALNSIDSTNIPSGISDELINSTDTFPFICEVSSDNLIKGYSLANDINGDPAFIYSVRMERSIYQSGLDMIKKFTIFMLIASVLFTFFTNAVLVKYILNPLVEMGRDVQRIAIGKDLTGRVNDKRGDEIGKLGREINFMLSAIEQSKEALWKSEYLLKEIHHRVKNNLQVIISLLSLQSATATDDATSDILRISQERVYSMALIHEKLYKGSTNTEYTEKIDFYEYLRDLSQNLISSYSLQNISIDVNQHGDSEGFLLDLEYAVPCGLIVNEMVTNSIKHAFVGRSSGEITIDLSKVGDTVTIVIADNGVGVQEKPGGGGIGMQIIDSLVKQIDGKMEVSSTDTGTEITITFKVQTGG